VAKFNAARGSASRIAWVFLPDSSSTTGAGKIGLTNGSAALNVSVRREKSAAVTTYSGANIGTIVTLGTWVNPGVGKVNFKEVDATNLQGIYELHFVDALFDTSDTSRWVAGMVSATGVAPSPFEVALEAMDAQNATSLGLTNLDATVSSRSTYAGGDTSGVTTLLARIASALTITAGKVDVNDKTGFSLTAAEEIAIADALLKRDFSAVSGEAARSALNALRFLRNLWVISGGILHVKKEDDSTDAWTGTVTTTAGNPVSQIDPT